MFYRKTIYITSSTLVNKESEVVLLRIYEHHTWRKRYETQGKYKFIGRLRRIRSPGEKVWRLFPLNVWNYLLKQAESTN